MAKVISKVYGDALYLYASENNVVEKTYEEAKDIRDVFSMSKELKSFLYAPTVTKKDKKEVLKKIFIDNIWNKTNPFSKLVSIFDKHNITKGENTKILNFVDIMIDKDREEEMLNALEYYLNKVREEKNIGIAKVVSAFPLNENQKKSLHQKLIDTTSYEKFDIDYDIDETLISGMKISIKDRVCDSSVKTKLQQISKNLRGVRV